MDVVVFVVLDFVDLLFLWLVDFDFCFYVIGIGVCVFEGDFYVVIVVFGID